MKFVEILHCEKVWLLTILPSPGTMANSISLFGPASRSVADIPEYTVVPTGADYNHDSLWTTIKRHTHKSEPHNLKLEDTQKQILKRMIILNVLYSIQSVS